VRLFFALWPPPATVAVLADWATHAQARTGGRVTRPESIHLTLAFLGEVTEARVADAIRAARSVRGGRHRLPIEQAKRWSHNDIIWVGPTEIPRALAALAQSLRTALEKEGFVVEARPFAAHVTLIRKAQRSAALPPLPRAAWPVTEFTLVSSTLSRQGSSYSIVDRIALA
jgi:2'-5' RNA ligase